jgi:hypothetical protein
METFEKASERLSAARDLAMDAHAAAEEWARARADLALAERVERLAKARLNEAIGKLERAAGSPR